MMSKQEKAVVGGIFAGALAVRLFAMSLAFDPSLKFEKYFDLAKELISNGWVAKDAFAYAPGYVYFMAVLWRLLGSPAAMCVVQLVLGSLTCVLLYAIARRLFDGRTAVVAGVWAAVYGSFLLYDLEFLSDSFGAFIYCAAGAALLRAMAQPSVPSFAFSGLLLGLRAIQRPNALLLVPLCLVILLFTFVREQGAKRVLVLCAALVLAVSVPILPISLQNYRATGDFILITDSGGYVFYCSNNHTATGLRYSPPGLVYEQARRDPTGEKTSVDLMDDALSRKTAGLAVGRDLSPAQSSRFWFNEGMKCVKRRGIGQAAFMAKKVFYMFNAYAAHDTFPVLVKEEKLWWLACLGIGTLAPFAALGMVVTLREWRRLALGYALVLTPVVSMMIFYVAPRFRLDLEAMLIPFGAAGGVWLFDRLRARDAKRALAACAGVAVLMMGNHFSDSDILKEKRVAEIQRHQFLGDIARDEGRVYDAVNKYRAAIALARYPSEAAECLRALAGVYRASGDSESARRCEQLARGALPPEMLQALSAHADNADARNTLGRHYLLSKEYGKAVEEFSQAVALDRYNPVLRLNLAEAMFQAKSANPDDAASEINASLEYGLRFSSLAYRGYTLLGRCFMAKGDWASARRSLEEALRLAPRYGPAHALLAEVYLKMGDKKLAEEHAAAAHSPGQ